MDTFDKNLRELCAKVVGRSSPPKKAHQAFWARCPLCQKKVVDSMIDQHIATSCVVGMMFHKIADIEKLIAMHNEDGHATNSPCCVASVGQPIISATLQRLPESVRALEQLRVNISIVNSVVPMYDLFPTPRDVSFETVRAHLSEVTARAHAWADQFRKVEPTKGAASPTAGRGCVQLSAALHPAPIEAPKHLPKATKLDCLSRLSRTKSRESVGKRQESPEGNWQSKFDEETLTLARGIESGEISFVEAVEWKKSHKKLPPLVRGSQ
jgi:hypothetical protein